MERGLIGHRAGEQCLAIVFPGDLQSFEPARPMPVEVALDANFVLAGFVHTAPRGL